MPLPALFGPVIVFLLREIVVKFVVFSAVFALVAFFVPFAVTFLAPHIGVGSLSSAFSGLGAGVWYFVDFLNLGYGLPLVISAFVARFLIRRLPLIG